MKIEKALSRSFPPDKRFAFEERNGLVTKQYSSAYAIAYNNKLNGMVQRRMRQSVFAVASFWYTAWVNAGQPDLKALNRKTFNEDELKEFETLNMQWRNGKIKGREE